MKSALLVAFAFLFASALTARAAEPCDPLGKVQFLCVGANAEDLAAIPNSDWVIPSCELRAVNAKDRTEVVLFSAEPKFNKAL